MLYNFISVVIDIPVIDFIKNMDRWLFVKINHNWTTSFLDSIFPLWREGMTWIPFYIFLIILVFVNFGIRAWPWVLGLIITVTITDQISSHLIKPWVNRPRPCHDPYLADSIRLLLRYCSNSRSFTSSHATNHFGVAVFVYSTFKPYFGRWGYLLFFWAATISYGQVYIGVHYPVDVLCGGLLGSVIGAVTATVYNKKIGIPALR